MAARSHKVVPTVPTSTPNVDMEDETSMPSRHFSVAQVPFVLCTAEEMGCTCSAYWRNRRKNEVDARGCQWFRSSL